MAPLSHCNWFVGPKRLSLACFILATLEEVPSALLYLRGLLVGLVEAKNHLFTVSVPRAGNSQVLEEVKIPERQMPKEIKIAQEVPPVVVDDSEPRLAARRTREPPKDAGQIYGDHPDCRNHIRYFKSLSEWNKHMKKHDRPYKCTNPGCNQRFTQSGVMHRHVREVHCEGKKWMCPYPDCNSSSGKGFKRKGGLDTHIRYVHTEAGRNSLRAQIAQLQREAMQRDSRLDKLERELKQALSPSVRLPSCAELEAGVSGN
ncbi:hypothetical protein I7I51_03196 [Histoplasma capsulatum]|uniref:C2H2-type domain-containing protein n=1 Tax=Ajellomyces capsulatus TaxID=5037 RepID=A0A8A1MQC3_AJECA|nr:hypothetical protein I7I51_03196 [Histoplasma capsulatum]